MSNHVATVEWRSAATAADFLKGRYTREHTWEFDGGATLRASASPSVVPAPWSEPAGVDPEEAFVAAVSSCHMLTFLYLASKAGFVVERYRDHAVGTMSKSGGGTPWISRVTLTPEITYGGDRRPGAEEEERLHHGAHEGCFIAASIKTEVVVAHAP
jgi:organic hydroperoxide reductase OsmC/OhrA